MFPDVFDIKSGRPDSRDSGDRVDKVRSFGDGINHYHNAVLAIGFREFRYEVDTDYIPGSIRDWKRMEFASWGMTGSFCTQASIASGDVFADVTRHLRPPVISRHQLERFPPTTMSCDLGIMTKGNNPTSQICRVRDIDLSPEM